MNAVTNPNAIPAVREVADAPATRGGSKILSWLCIAGGFASILASIVIWYNAGGTSPDPMVVAHAERFGIFVGLWAPTFFILSNRFDRSAQSYQGL